MSNDLFIHTCHARNCNVEIPPRLFMCPRHWRMVPSDIQSAIWHHYRPGQEIDKKPSAEYMEVALLAIEVVAGKERTTN